VVVPERLAQSAPAGVASAKAGFVLEPELDLFRNPGDDRQKAFVTPGTQGTTTDGFALRFRKP
jgi:predicted methyltransferase